MRTRHTPEYARLHYWIKTHKEKPAGCEHCGRVKKLDWANVSHEYKQELSDWMALCRSCHMLYDGAPGKMPDLMVRAIRTLRLAGVSVAETMRITGTSNTTVARYAAWLAPKLDMCRKGLHDLSYTSNVYLHPDGYRLCYPCRSESGRLYRSKIKQDYKTNGNN